MIGHCLSGVQKRELGWDDGSPDSGVQAVEAGWAAVEPFQNAWAREDERHGARDLASYPAGTDGPEEANQLVERDGRSWRPLT